MSGSTYPSGFYIEREGREFGLVERVRIRRDLGPGPGQWEVPHELESVFYVFPVLRVRVWGLLHGYGWMRVR